VGVRSSDWGGVPFVKGHGTQNDFVLLPDADGTLELTDGRVVALCDRRAGLGADGVLRVVRASAMPDGTPGREADATGWFMDYRNADGSAAEMCGNGLRVFARYLRDAGLVDPTEFAVHTRAGPRAVAVHDDGSVQGAMGQVRLGGASVATLGGVEYAGARVDVGNPHLVCVLEAPVAALDLRTAPACSPAEFPEGVNVEFVNVVTDERIAMRVHERGVGETRSCGTGTVAAAAAALRRSGRDEGTLTVDVPGGRVAVGIAAGAATLSGPAELVASGHIAGEWWQANR
jgi:diaminopimelate epimerase